MKRIVLFCILLCLFVGVVSADTLITYDAYEGTPGYTTQDTLINMYTHAGDGTLITSYAVYAGSIATDSLTDYYLYHYQSLVSYNTTLPAGSTITAVKATFFASGYVVHNLGGSNSACIIYATPASQTSFVAADYQHTNYTRMATDVTFASIPASPGMVNFTFNAFGIGATNKNGLTTIMLDDSGSVDQTGLTWADTEDNAIGFFSLAHGGGTIPFLTITYTAGATTPVASFTKNHNTLRIPNRITVTDTSTNTPTSWQWSWGDGTANSTTQNPSHQYLKRGVFTINMAATNAGGTGVAAAQAVRVVGYQDVQE